MPKKSGISASMIWFYDCHMTLEAELFIGIDNRWYTKSHADCTVKNITWGWFSSRRDVFEVSRVNTLAVLEVQTSRRYIANEYKLYTFFYKCRCVVIAISNGRACSF